jgi:hypothetical protein
MSNLKPCYSILGHLIVEVVDHRTKVAQDSKPSKKRVILSPSQETLWADLSLLHEESGEGWSSQLMLDVESKILVSRGCHYPLYSSTQLGHDHSH